MPEIKIIDDKITIDIVDLIRDLPQATKQRVVESLTLDIVKELDQYLKGGTDYYSHCNGEYAGAIIRQKALETQGIEPEFQKDLERKIQYEQ